MTFAVNAVEGVWLATNLITFIVTLAALWDTWHARTIVLRLNGRAREIVATGNVRREVIRLIVQSLLLFTAVPAILLPGEIELTWGLAFLMAAPVFLLGNSVLDTYDRKRVVRIISDEIESDRRASLTRIEAKGDRLQESIDENTRISQEASDHADSAYREANQVNEKIAAQGEAIIRQGDERAEDHAVTIEIKATGEDTNIKVTKIAEKDVPHD